MDIIAFTSVAEDLVEKTASEASQNMNIDASDHAAALDQAIGKTRLFTIGMNLEYFSKFSINYVLKKSYPVDDQTALTTPQDPTNKDALALTSPTNTNPSQSSDITTPYAQSSGIVVENFLDKQSECPDVENPIRSNTKRQLHYDKDDDVNNDSNTITDNTNNTDDDVNKRQKASLEDPAS